MTDFERHWETNKNNQVANNKKDVAFKFLRPVLNMLREMKGVHILDVGCGDGVHAQVLSKNEAVFSYSGIDVSQNAVSAARSRVDDERFKFSVEDIMSTSLDSDIFDIVFSYGVIAYTNSPVKAMQELARLTKPGGVIGIWVYPRPTGVLGLLFKMTRWLCIKGGDKFTYFVANIIVPFLRLLPVSSGVNLGNATWKQCREVVLVNIAPLKLIFPDRSEVVSWFSEAGLEVVSEDLDNPITIWAVKK